jgi:hypothetical protein
MQNLIVLDIDGVLNRHQNGRDFEPDCCAALSRILYATRASIVISSTWRGLIRMGDFSLAGFERMLRSHGIRGGSVIGYTRASRSGETRAMEIGDWLKENRSPTGERRICILDDDQDAFGGRPGVLVNGRVGLTEADADEAIAILESKEQTP